MATSTEILMNELEKKNIAIVDSLYKAISQGNTSTVAKLIASDIEWWFHGPPHCQHMMRKLTGSTKTEEFRFEPRSIEAIVGDDGCVIVEGWEGAKAYWVHVWTLKNGLITQFREYFNTWLTVKDLKSSSPSSSSSSSSRWGTGQQSRRRHTLWQSQPRDLARRSLPGLLLAI
ncbi:hypothetical protein ACFE04_003406 [Oxalis oulophora]